MVLEYVGANNHGYVDACGQVIPLKRQYESYKGSDAKNIANVYSLTTQSPTCWVCNHWREHRFVFAEATSIPRLKEPNSPTARDSQDSIIGSSGIVYMRLELDDWFVVLLRENSLNWIEIKYYHMVLLS